MGLIRKATSVGTLGVVGYRSKSDRRVRADEQAARAAMIEARAQRGLMRAQQQLTVAQLRQMQGLPVPSRRWRPWHVAVLVIVTLFVLVLGVAALT